MLFVYLVLACKKRRVFDHAKGKECRTLDVLNLHVAGRTVEHHSKLPTWPLNNIRSTTPKKDGTAAPHQSITAQEGRVRKAAPPQRGGRTTTVLCLPPPLDWCCSLLLVGAAFLPSFYCEGGGWWWEVLPDLPLLRGCWCLSSPSRVVMLSPHVIWAVLHFSPSFAWCRVSRSPLLGRVPVPSFFGVLFIIIIIMTIVTATRTETKTMTIGNSLKSW